MLTKVESEIAQGHVEVEVEGLTLTRFLCIYAAGAREAKLRMRNGMRSLFRPDPPHHGIGRTGVPRPRVQARLASSSLGTATLPSLYD